MTDLNLGSLPAVLPFLVSLHGFDYKSVAGLVFASCCLSTVVQPYFGWLADRVRRHWFMGAGVLIAGLSFALVGFLENYWAIFLAVLATGFGSTVFHPEAAKLVHAASAGKRATGMSLFSVGGKAGFGAGPILAVLLVTLFGLKGLAFYGILALVFGSLLFVFAPVLSKNAGNALPRAAAGKQSAAQSRAGRNDWPAFSRLTVFIVLRSACDTGIGAFLPLYCIYSLGTSEATGGFMVSALAAAGILCTLIGGPLGDRYGCERMIRIGSFLLIPALAAAFLTHSLFLLVAMLVPISFAFNVTYSPFVVLGQNYLAKSIGFASGVTLGVSFSAGGILAPALGWLGDAYGVDLTMAALVALALLAHAVTWTLPRGSGRPESEPGAGRLRTA